MDLYDWGVTEIECNKGFVNNPWSRAYWVCFMSCLSWF